MSDHTPLVNIRVPARLWAAYGRCTARINGGRDRTEDLVRHMAKLIELLGDDADKADLAAALNELEVRWARKGGRPRKGGSRMGAALSPARELKPGGG